MWTFDLDRYILVRLDKKTAYIAYNSRTTGQILTTVHANVPQLVL